MRESQVPQLMAYMTALDGRERSEYDEGAWWQMPIVRATDLELAIEALVYFHNRPPREDGRSHYIDPQQFLYCVRQVKRLKETEEARLRASRAITPGRPDPKPADFQAKVEAAMREKARQNREKLQDALNGIGRGIPATRRAQGGPGTPR